MSVNYILLIFGGFVQQYCAMPNAYLNANNDEIAIQTMRNFVTNGDNENSLGKIFEHGQLSVKTMLKVYKKLESGIGLDVAADIFTHKNVDTIRSTKAVADTDTNLTYKLRPVLESEKMRKAEFRLERSPLNSLVTIVITISRGGANVRSFYLRVRPLQRLEHSVIDVTRYIRPWLTNKDVHLELKVDMRACSTLSCRRLPASSLVFILFTENKEFVKHLHGSGVITAPSVLNLTGSSSDGHSSRRKRDTRKLKTRKRFKGSRRRKLCRTKKFMVDFNYMGWGKYIVLPKQYDAKLCRGTCPSPVKQELSPTNHALLQSLMRLGNTDIPMPCCVPTKLKPLSMLYYEHGDVVVRHHADMIVEKCGCR